MVYNALITLGAAAVQITAAVNGLNIPAGVLAKRILIEPLRGNTHVAYVGDLNVTATGTGAAIQELAAPVANTPLDRFHVSHGGSVQPFDPSDYWVHGTTGERLKATVWPV